MVSYLVATSGEDGRKALMTEIELGRVLAKNPQPNIINFIGCVTTQRKALFSHIFPSLFICYVPQQIHKTLPNRLQEDSKERAHF